MTVLVDLLVVAGGVVLARWVARSFRANTGGRSGERKASPGDRAEDREDGQLRGLPLQVGDVILRTAEHDEAWLAGALVFEEEAPVAALFVAPEAGADRAVFVRAAAGAGLVWLTPTTSFTADKGAEPPHTLEVGGARFERVRRLPVKTRRVGAGAPAVGAQAVLAEYAGLGAERVLVVAGTERALAWRGQALAEGDYEVLPGERGEEGVNQGS